MNGVGMGSKGIDRWKLPTVGFGLFMGFRSSVSPVQTHGRGWPVQIRAVGVGAYTVLR